MSKTPTPNCITPTLQLDWSVIPKCIYYNKDLDFQISTERQGRLPHQHIRNERKAYPENMHNTFIAHYWQYTRHHQHQITGPRLDKLIHNNRLYTDQNYRHYFSLYRCTEKIQMHYIKLSYKIPETHIWMTWWHAQQTTRKNLTLGYFQLRRWLNWCTQAQMKFVLQRLKATFWNSFIQWISRDAPGCTSKRNCNYSSPRWQRPAIPSLALMHCKPKIWRQSGCIYL